MYAYIDGDDIGLSIENSFMCNDEYRLKNINDNVKGNIQKITEHLLDLGNEIIFSGADGIICKGDNIDAEEILKFIRSNVIGISFSIGIGNSLCDSFLALRYAKSSGKDVAAILKNGFEIIK